MSRLFTFGCSFTNYYWPTWADILSFNYDEFQNYGKLAGGNMFIACTLSEAIAVNKINKNDTVIIMWTNVTREDRYIKNWHGVGNIFTQDCYSWEFVKKYITIRGCYVRDLALIALVDQTLQNIGCNYEFLSMTEMNNYAQYTYENGDDYFKDGLEIYKDTIAKIKPSVHKVIFNNDWDSRPILEKHSHRLDAHPLPNEHIEYLQKVLPNYNISEDAYKLAQTAHNDIINQFLTKGCFVGELYKNPKNIHKYRL